MNVFGPGGYPLWVNTKKEKRKQVAIPFVKEFFELIETSKQGNYKKIKVTEKNVVQEKDIAPSFKVKEKNMAKESFNLISNLEDIEAVIKSLKTLSFPLMEEEIASLLDAIRKVQSSKCPKDYFNVEFIRNGKKWKLDAFNGGKAIILTDQDPFKKGVYKTYYNCWLLGNPSQSFLMGEFNEFNIEAKRELEIYKTLMKDKVCPTLYHSFTFNKKLLFLVEKYPQDLYELETSQAWKSKTNLNKVYLFRNVVELINKIHEKRIVYLNLKSESILIKEQEVLFCDFGGSCPIESVKGKNVGIPEYIPVDLWPIFNKKKWTGSRAYDIDSWQPRFISNEKQAYAADVWCLGCLLYLITYGKDVPWAEALSKNNYLEAFHCYEEFSNSSSEKPIDEIIKKTLCQNYEERLSLEKLKEQVDELVKQENTLNMIPSSCLDANIKGFDFEEFADWSTTSNLDLELSW